MLAFALERHPSILYGGTAMASAVVGLMVARAQVGISLPLVALAGLALILIMVSVPPSTLFVGWLFLAPLLASANASPIGKPLQLAFYALPALVLAIVTATHHSRATSLSFADFLPAAYVVYVLTSIALTSPVIEPSVARSVEVVFLNVALGSCLYYFLVVGPGVTVKTTTVLRVLMAGACVEAVLGLIETATAWNLWGYHDWSNVNGGLRAVATFTNPGLLGAYLGVGVAIAAAILAWDGPHHLRRLARLTLVLCIPALFVTLTRGPIVATAVAVLLLLVAGRRRLLAIALIACSALALVAAWPQIRSSSVYEQRAANVETVLVREQIQRVSIVLWRERPILGWGFDSFDRVKNETELPFVPGLPSNIYRYAQAHTSHNTYLTVLVELGVVGLLLLLAPFAAIVARALARARAVTADRWIAAAAAGSLVVVFLNGLTLDYRFFSLVPALPFVMLAILRRLTGTWEASTGTTSAA
jgi:O-antigen ligase